MTKTVKFCTSGAIPCPEVDSECELHGPCNHPCDTDCGCNPSQVPCPQPFYAEAVACQSPGGSTTYIAEYRTALKSNSQFNIPACGETAIVGFACVKTMPVGAYIWNAAYGYFEVTAFDPDNGNTTILNNCNDGNATPGTSVPKCTDFIVTPPPCCTGGSGQNPDLFPYVKIDFTAQISGACQEITVTSVNGLAVGKNVQIGTGTYRVSAITSASLITICNDGAGIAPGTSVIAKDSAGNYQYPIILIDTSPCTNSQTQTGTLLVCSAGVVEPLTGLAAGSIPVLTNPTTGEVTFQVTGQPTFTCATLTQSLTLSTGQATYTITVNDTANFNITDVLQIGTRTDRFTVTGIPDSTHLVGDLDPVPGSIQLIPAGTSICLISCCESLQDQVDQINQDLQFFLYDNLAIKVASFTATPKSGTINGIGNLVSNTTIVSVTNSAHIAHNLVLMFSFSDIVTLTLNNVSQTAPLDIEVEQFIDIDGGGFNRISADRRLYVVATSSSADVVVTPSRSLAVTVAPGATTQYTLETSVLSWTSNITTDVDFAPRIDMIGVSV